MRFLSPQSGPDTPEWLQVLILGYLALGIGVALVLSLTVAGGRKMKVPFIAALAKQQAITLPLWWAAMWWVERTLSQGKS